MDLRETTDASGVLAKPAEERSECLDWIEVRGATITAHDRHVCRRNFPHDVHRCTACTVTWSSKGSS